MICDQCHQDKPDVRTVIDPFAYDVWDKEIEMDLCKQCEQDRRDDI